MKNLTFRLRSTSAKATLFILACLCIGYLGVQKFTPKLLIFLGGGLFASGAIAGLVELAESKKKKPKEENVANL